MAYVEYDDEPRSPAVSTTANPKRRAPKPPTRRPGPQVRTVIATGKSACGGRSRLWAFGAEDLAAFVGITSPVPGRAAAAFLQAVKRKLVDPTNLESLLAFRDRRGGPGLRCDVFANGRRVAAVTVLTIIPGKDRITVAVRRVRAVEGRRWEGREVDLTIPLGGAMQSYRGTLTRTLFEGA